MDTASAARLERSVATERLSDSMVMTGDHDLVHQKQYIISSVPGLVIGDQAQVTKVLAALRPRVYSGMPLPMDNLQAGSQPRDACGS